MADLHNTTMSQIRGWPWKLNMNALSISMIESIQGCGSNWDPSKRFPLVPASVSSPNAFGNSKKKLGRKPKPLAQRSRKWNPPVKKIERSYSRDKKLRTLTYWYYALVPNLKNGTYSSIHYRYQQINIYYRGSTARHTCWGLSTIDDSRIYNIRMEETIKKHSENAGWSTL